MSAPLASSTSAGASQYDHTEREKEEQCSAEHDAGCRRGTGSREADLFARAGGRTVARTASAVARTACTSICAVAAGVVHEHLTLQALDDDAVRTIAADLTHDQREETVRVAGGNPLFARVLVAAFRRHPEATRAQGALRQAHGS